MIYACCDLAGSRWPSTARAHERRLARNLLQAARRQLTRDWWKFKCAKHELFTSQLVLDEIAFGEPEMAKRRLELVTDLTLLESTEEAPNLTRRSGRAN